MVLRFVNLGEELKGEGAGRELTLHHLSKKKPCRLESVPGRGNHKGQGLEAYENKIISHSTKVHGVRQANGCSHPSLLGQESNVFSSPFHPLLQLGKYM